MWHRIGDARSDVTLRLRVGRVPRDVPRALAILLTTSQAVQTFAVEWLSRNGCFVRGGQYNPSGEPDILMPSCRDVAVWLCSARIFRAL